MPRLLLVRHAEAEAEAPEGDASRPLTAQGEAGATQAGLYLRESRLLPDHAISSPARRARATLDAILRELPQEPASCEINDALYYADSDTLLDVLTQISGTVETLLLIGHNPGLSQFARLIVKSEEALPNHFPSPCLAVIELLCAAWSNASAGCGTLDRFKVFSGCAGDSVLRS